MNTLRSPDRRQLQTYVVIGVALAALFALIFVVWALASAAYLGWSLRTTCLVSTAVAALSVGLVSLLAGDRAFTFCGLYAVMFTVFHFGIVIPYALGFPLAYERYWWFEGALLQEAILLCDLGVSAFALGAVALHRKRGSGLIANDRSDPRLYGPIGFSLVLIGCLTWYWIVFSRGGLSVLLGSYGGYLQSTEHPLIHYVWLAQGLGITLVAAQSRPAWRLRTVMVFGVWALTAFPLGLRGEVLFPIAVALPVLVKGGMVIRKRYVVIGIAVLLPLVAGIRMIRSQGVKDTDYREVTYNPLDAVYEMGAQVHVVKFVCGWRDDGDPPLWGRTYARPIERAAGQLIPGMNIGKGTEDNLLMNVYVVKRESLKYGPGFSPVAEAYVNFNEVGVLAIMGLMGIIFSTMDSMRTTAIRLAISGAIFLPFIIQIRNSFTAVPFQIAIGLLLIWLLERLETLLNHDKTEKTRD